MPGYGKWDPLNEKVRPGTYANVESDKQYVVGLASRGTMILPLANHKWGPKKEWITITNASPDAAKDKLGYSIYDNDASVLMIREAMKKAKTIKIWIPNDEGEKAKASVGGITITAKYSGTRGNDITVSVTENIDNSDTFDVTTYIDGTVLCTIEGVQTLADLKMRNNSGTWVEFSGDAEDTVLTAAAGVKLAGGTDTSLVNGNVSAMLDASETISWNTMAFPFEDASLCSALLTKIKYIREEMGKGVVAVAPNFEADYEGIISVLNGVVLSDGTKISNVLATAWVAAASASATNRESLTGVVYEGADKTLYVDTENVEREMSNEEIVAGIKAGHFIFSRDEDSVVVEYDINSLTTFGTANKKDKGYAKNMIIRIYDSFVEMLQKNFKPNRYRNNAVGWGIMKGIGKSILDSFERNEVIQNVDYDADFLIDEELSHGDETYFIVGLQAVDMAEKLFFTIKTR